MEIPDHEVLPTFCQDLWKSGERSSKKRAYLPWEDFLEKPHKFAVMTLLSGGRSYYNRIGRRGSGGI